MATTSQNLEAIANNVAALARESAIILEKGKSVETKETYKDPSSYTADDIATIGAKLEQNFSSYFNYKDYTLPVLYLSGETTGMSKENKVDLTYKYGNVSGTCTCKWQGNYSLRWPKKNYTIAKLSTALDLGWGSQKKYVLKADYEDPSYVRNVGCAKLWGQIIQARTSTDVITTKLKACPNGGAVDGFPIVLVLNDKFQGLYNFNVPKDKWMMGMGSGTQEAILPCEAGTGANFKALVTKANLEAENGFSVEYATDEDDIDWIVASLNNFISFTINNQNNSNFKQSLSQYVDVDSAIDYYIFSCLIANWDGVIHNYILSTYDGTKWFFTPYDMDKVMTNNADPNFAKFASSHNLMNLFYKYDKQALKQRYLELRSTILSEKNVFDTFKAHTIKIPTEVFDADNKVWPKMSHPVSDMLAYLMNWYRLRCQIIDAEVESWNV